MFPAADKGFYLNIVIIIAQLFELSFSKYGEKWPYSFVYKPIITAILLEYLLKKRKGDSNDPRGIGGKNKT